MEVALDQLPRLDRLRPGGLPAGARQSRLDTGGEEAEHDCDEQPRDQYDPEVGRGVAAKSPDGTDASHQTVTSMQAVPAAGC